MSLHAWDPWQDVRRFQEDVNRLFQRPTAAPSEFDFPPLNVTPGEAGFATPGAPLAAAGAPPVVEAERGSRAVRRPPTSGAGPA